MRHSFLPVAVMSLGIMLVSCGAPAPQQVADTRAADEKALRQLEEDWVKVAAAKDPEKFASNYLPDASLYLTGAPAMRGSHQIVSGLKQAMSDANFSLAFKTARVHVAKSGDLACTEGSYDQSASDPATKKKVAEKGNYLTCWMKQADGTWKVIADITAAEPTAVPVK